MRGMLNPQGTSERSGPCRRARSLIRLEVAVGGGGWW